LVQENLAEASNNLVYSAIVVYTLAMFVLAAEWAFGSRTRFAVAEAPAGARRAPAQPAAHAQPPPDDKDRRRGEKLGRIGFSLATLAFLLHLAGVLARGLSVQRWPWGNMYEFSTAAALATMATFLVLARRYQVRWLGVFVVTPVLLTLGLAVLVLYTDPTRLQPSLQTYWLAIHVFAAVVSSGLFTVGAVLSVLYLVRARAEAKAALPGGTAKPSQLPSAAALDRLAYRVHAFVFPLWTFAIIAGAIWAESAWKRYWGWDPKETWAFITWVMYAAYLHARTTAGWKGRKAAYVALLGWLCLMFNYFVINIFINGLHSYAGLD
jgi:cytochrome c-type biogenesis protein CcsB